MDFARPDYLYLLSIAPLAVVFLAWAAARRRKALVSWGQPALLASLTTSLSHHRRRWKTALQIAALLAVILALARPRWGSQVTVKAQEGVEVMVALDVSASMMAEDIKPNRLARAKLTIEELMGHLGGNEIGLVIFSGAAFVQFPLTADVNTARAFLDSAGPWSISRPGTALSEAIRVALRGFPEERATSRVIVLLTDGESHEGDPLAAAREATQEDVIIHAIGFGSPRGEPVPIRDSNGALVGYKRDEQGQTVLSRLDEVTLQQVALETGGLYFRASAAGQEVDAIVDAIARLETGEREGQFETEGVERSEWFAGCAVLALVADWLIPDRRPKRLGG